MENGSIFSNFFYIYPKIIIPLGIIFNSLNVILFSSKKLSKVSISFMIRILAISHILNLINFGFWSFNGLDQQNLDSSTVILCKIISINSYIFLGSNSWILVFISLDRLIMILFPKKPKIFRYKYFYVFASTIIYVYNFLFYIPTLIFYDLIESNDINETFCDILDPRNEKMIILMDFFNSIIFPFGFMFFLSLFIINSLKKAKNKIQDVSSLATKQKNRNLKFSITILALNFVFLFLMSPYAIAYILNDNNAKDFGNFFMVLYSSIDFFIYMATNSIMREEFLSIFFSLSFILPKL